MKPFVILSGTSHPEFAKKIADELGVKLGNVEIAQFSDSETHVIVHEDVAGKEVFLVQSGYAPTNERLMELLLLAEAVWNKKAKRITVILPFVPYRRQEKQTKNGEALSFEVVARLLRAVGVRRVLTIDLHKHRSRRFFKDQHITCKELRAFPVFVDFFKKQKSLEDVVVVAPDKGSIPESEKYARTLKVPLVRFYKRRTKRDQIVIDRFEGSVKGKNVLIIDDEINTGGTLVGVVQTLKKNGAGEVHFACTHGVLSGPAIERLSSSSLEHILITDTIPQSKEKRIKKMTIVSVASLFAQQVRQWVK
ncbi:MAG: ribose-phosphate pyrophosphokinase [Candidatus Kerfeldbacteria bacterium]|nr:ribose-phosphate pyrophosphokinase [Candidatus Kerfeldbacteria bacterium]